MWGILANMTRVSDMASGPPVRIDIEFVVLWHTSQSHFAKYVLMYNKMKVTIDRK
jgi:hypothetical protein